MNSKTIQDKIKERKEKIWKYHTKARDKKVPLEKLFEKLQGVDKDETDICIDVKGGQNIILLIVFAFKISKKHVNIKQ